LKTVRDEAAKALTTYGWIDKKKGIAHIPIDRAMELAVAELAQRKPAPAGPIATPEPQAAAAPASNAPGSPAPGASPQTSPAQPAASPPGQTPVSSSPAASQPPPGTASPVPGKTP